MMPTRRSFLLLFLFPHLGALLGDIRVDLDEECAEWASEGKCARGEHVLMTSPRSCASFEDDCVEEDTEEDSKNESENGSEEGIESFILEDEDEKQEETDFVIDMGVPQKLESKDIEIDGFLKAYHEGINHLAAVATNPDLAHILPECKNKDPLCTQWAVEGWCEMDRYFMDAECCPVCWSSPQLDFLQRCPMDPNVPNAWRPGDVNRFFQNLTTDEKYTKYEPRVWSRPSYLPSDTSETADYEEEPWIVTLENVVTEEEANLLIEWGETHGWKRSLDGDNMQPDGTWVPTVTEGRTSRQAWCGDMCYTDPRVKNILKRLSDITNIPETYSDFIQLLRYEPGQFYHTHHDFHNFQVHSATGHRILTFYTYLSDVEEGGGTNFPELDITVHPKRGRALIWPNVKDKDPNKWDSKTKHQALPLIEGMKYGATAWFHMRDFKGPWAYGCDE